MSKWTKSDLDAARARTERARNPVQAAASDQAKAERFEAGREAELQDLIEQYALVNGCCVMRPPMRKRSQYPIGWPDLTIMKDGKCCLVEAKTDGNDLSADQIACIALIRMAGMPVLVCWDFSSAQKFIQAYLLS